MRQDRENREEMRVGSEHTRHHIRHPRTSRASRGAFRGAHEEQRRCRDEQYHQAVAARFLRKANVVWIEGEEGDSYQSGACSEEARAQSMKEGKRSDGEDRGEASDDPFSRPEMNPAAKQ